LSVQELLNGVDIEGSREQEGRTWGGPAAPEVFISYSHKDEALRSELETHLKLLQREGVIDVWNDRKIGAGEDWKNEIDRHLEAAEIILLLISADFIASDYCYDKEMKRALERHEAKKVTVIPIVLRDVDWQIAPFAKLMALPKGGRPVMRWRQHDTAWKDVAAGIRYVVEARADVRRA